MHVACEDHQIDVVRSEDVVLLRFGAALVVGANRHEVEGHSELLGHVLEIGVVGDDNANRTVELTQAVTPQEVVQAMAVARDE